MQRTLPDGRAGRFRPVGGILFCLWLLLPAATLHAQWDARLAEDLQRFSDRWLADRVVVGARVTQYTFTAAERRTYDEFGNFQEGLLGSIVEIDEENSFSPTFFVRVRLGDFVSLELGWEQLEGATVKYRSDYSDGDLNASGPTFIILGRYPNASRFTPYLGMGLVFLDTRFEAWGPWHYGFSSHNLDTYDTWVAQGADLRVNGGYRRNIETDDTIGFVVNGGCCYRIADAVSGELVLRIMDADVDTRYYLSWYGTDRVVDGGEYSLPLDNWAVQIGITYGF